MAARLPSGVRTSKIGTVFCGHLANMFHSFALFQFSGRTQNATVPRSSGKSCRAWYSRTGPSAPSTTLWRSTPTTNCRRCGLALVRLFHGSLRATPCPAAPRPAAACD